MAFFRISKKMVTCDNEIAQDLFIPSMSFQTYHSSCHSAQYNVILGAY